MNRTIFASFVTSCVMLLAPVAAFAATTDTAHSLSSELSSVAASVNSLASSTISVSVPVGQMTNGLDAHNGGELKIINAGTYHTNDPLSFTSPVHLSKIIFQFIPCTGASPSVCAASAAYPAVTSYLALNQSTLYLNYKIQLATQSATSSTLQVTDVTQYNNIQNELSSISARIAALLGK